MAFLDYLAASVLTSGAMLAAAIWIFQASFSRALDKRMDIFRQQLALDAKAYELSLKSQIEFRERQIGEFYGPIYALLKRGRPIHRLWAAGKLEQIDSFVRELAVQSNDTIANILLSKSHLLDGETFPESHQRYLTHVAVWHGYLRAGLGGVPLSKAEFPEAYYPMEFEEQIFATTERLRAELVALHARNGVLTGAG